jgi:CIC family chloride channel protein
MISAVTAATVAYFMMGEKVLLSFSVVEAFNIKNIPWYLVLGVITGLVSVLFSKTSLYIESLYSKISNAFVRVFTGGMAVALLIFFFPPFYSEGYDTIRELLEGRSLSVFENSPFSGIGGTFAVYLLFFIGLVLLKAVASSSTIGAGGIGGIFAPTLFTGGVTGFAVYTILNHFAGIEIADNRFVLVGMAGAMAGVMHAPLTAIFLIAEITGGYALLIPLIITSTISFITARTFQSHSIYHIQLAEKGELITHDKDKAVLTLMNWKSEIERDLIRVRANNTLGELVKVISKSKRNIFPVVDQYNILEGVVLLDDVREIMFNSELYNTVTVRELMRIPPSYLDVRESIETVMDTFEKTGAWNLPVLDSGIYVGFISKSRIYARYRELLLQFSEE